MTQLLITRAEFEALAQRYDRGRLLRMRGDALLRLHNFHARRRIIERHNACRWPRRGGTEVFRHGARTSSSFVVLGRVSPA